MEQKKLKHSHIWLPFLVIPLLPAFMGAGNYLNNLEVLKSEWFSLWTQISLFYANFFYGPLIAIYCSYIWRLEHLNHNWNSLMTMPVQKSDIFISKLLLAMGCTIFLQLWMWVLYLSAGKVVGLPGLPSMKIMVWILRGSFGGLVTAALQMLLSMWIRSFSVPIALALLGSIIGLFASNGGYGLFWPYSLMLMGMNANHDADMVGNLAGFIVSVVCFLLLFTAAGIWYLKNRDVVAG